MAVEVFIAVSPLIALLAVGILASNTFVLVIFARYRTVRVPQNIFIFTLCLADLFVGLNLPVQLALNLMPKLLTENPHLCAYRHACVILPIAVSLMDIAAISIDRVVSIVYSLRYESIVTMRRSVLVSVFIWVYNIVVFFVLIMLWHNDSKDPLIQCTPRILTKEYAAFVIALHLIFLVLVVVVCYVIIFAIVYQKLKANTCMPAEASVTPETRRLKRHFHAAKTVGLVLGTLFIAWIPNTIMYIVIIMKEIPPSGVLNDVVKVTMYLPPLHSLLNPFLYALRLPDFKKAAHHLRKCGKEETQPHATLASSAVH